MLLTLVLTTAAAAAAAASAAACKTDIDCSLNGLCAGGSCVCDKPWGGSGCGVLQYKKAQAVSTKNLYPFNDTDAPKSGPCVMKGHTCGALNTWNGPIAGPVAGNYHMYNPLYKKGSLLKTQAMLHGVSTNIEGPYTWTAEKNMGSNPAFVTFNGTDGKTKYTLWVGGNVYISDSVEGPFTQVAGRGPGGNPAPIYHKGAWYATSQSTREIVTTPNLGGKWTKFADIKPHLDHGTQE